MPDLALPLVLVAAGGAHAWATVVVGRRRHDGIDLWPALAFIAGLAVLALAVLGPLDQHAERRLSWHMVQHLVLISVVAPLLALGHPLRLAGALAGRSDQRSARFSGAGAAALGAVVSLAALFVWHLPAMYQPALHDDALHGAEHLSLIAATALLWHALLGSRDLGAGVLWLYLVTLPMTAFGVWMTIATTPWYRDYVGADGRAAAVRDQQLAGVVMWGFGGLAAVIAAVSLFATWLTHVRPGMAGAKARSVP